MDYAVDIKDRVIAVNAGINRFFAAIWNKKFYLTLYYGTDAMLFLNLAFRIKQ